MILTTGLVAQSREDLESTNSYIYPVVVINNVFLIINTGLVKQSRSNIPPVVVST